MKKIKTTETGREKNMLSAIKDITKADSETYWILWKYAPDLLTEKIDTFEELKSKYAVFADKTEEACNKYIYKEDVQSGIKYLLKRLDAKRDIELYNKYYELAMKGDVQALKAYMEFKRNFFDENETDELKTILANASTSIDYDDVEDFQMDF